MTLSWTELAAQASQEALAFARTVLEQDVADHAWGKQIGPVLTQRDTARLLGRSEQAVSKDARLLRVRNRDGRPIYPVVQFDGRRELAGIDAVVRALSDVVEPLTIAAWLTASNESLGRRRPLDALRDGDIETVLAVATRFAKRAAV